MRIHARRHADTDEKTRCDLADRFPFRYSRATT